MGGSGWAWGLMAFTLFGILPGVLAAGVTTPIGPVLSLSVAPPSFEGNSGSIAFTYTLTLVRNGSTDIYPYTWAVTGGALNPADAADFGGAFPSGTGTFAPGETSKTITVLVMGDTAVEPDEAFVLTVACSGVGTVTANGTILNDDFNAGLTEPTTLQTSASHGFGTFITSAPMPVGFYADGQPFVVSDRAGAFSQITPDSVEIASGAFNYPAGVPAQGNYRAHGTMKNPWMPAAGGYNPPQGFDRLWSTRNTAENGNTTTMWDYDPDQNIDPGKTGAPIPINIGDEYTLVKSIRADGLVTPSNSFTSFAKDFCFIHVVKKAPPLGAFAPSACDLDKTSYYTTGNRNKLALGTVNRGYVQDPGGVVSVNQTPLPAIDDPLSFSRSTQPMFGQKVDLRKRVMLTPINGYAGTYGGPWTDFYLAMIALGPDCPDWAYNRVLAFAIQLDGYYKRGKPTDDIGGAGAGQWCGFKFPYMLLAHTYPTDTALMTRATDFRGNATHMHFYTPSNFVNMYTYFPGGHNVNHGAYQEPTVGRPSWGVEVASNPPATHPKFDANIDADYEFVSGKVSFGEQIAIAMLQNGPNGWWGIQTSSRSATLTTAAPMSAHMAYMDRMFTFLLVTNNPYGAPPAPGKYREIYRAWRGFMPLPRYECVPENVSPYANLGVYLFAGTGAGGAAGTAGGTPLGAFAWRLDLIEHSYPVALSADVEYSLDRISWVRCPSTSLNGASPVLPPGTYWVRWRMTNAKGTGPWSVNYKRVTTDTAERMTVTVGGSAQTGTTTSTLAPAFFVSKYTNSAEPIYDPVAQPFSLTATPIIYIGRGMQIGAGATGAATYQVYRNNLSTPISGATSNAYNLTAADAGQNLIGVVTVNGVTFQTNTIAIPAAPTRPAGVIIDQQIDATLPIFYPAVYQSAKDNLYHCSELKVEPLFSDVGPDDGSDDEQPTLYVGRMRGICAPAPADGSFARLQVNLAADVPLTVGKKYHLSGISAIMGTTGKPMLGRLIVRLGKTPFGTDYFNSDVTGPTALYAAVTANEPRLVPIDITTPVILSGTGSGDLWLTIVANAPQATPGDPQITGHITVTEVP